MCTTCDSETSKNTLGDVEQFEYYATWTTAQSKGSGRRLHAAARMWRTKNRLFYRYQQRFVCQSCKQLPSSDNVANFQTHIDTIFRKSKANFVEVNDRSKRQTEHYDQHTKPLRQLQEGHAMYTQWYEKKSEEWTPGIVLKQVLERFYDVGTRHNIMKRNRVHAREYRGKKARTIREW